MTITLLAVLILVAIAVIAVAIFAVFHERRDKGFEGLNPEQMKEKDENLARSLSLAHERGEIANDDIERLLGVSNATAERYLNELESQGHLVQIGKTGKGVIYKVK
jgi:Fic family protein